MKMDAREIVPSAEKAHKTTISILGDLVTTSSNQQTIKEKDWVKLCGEKLLREISSSSFTIINLEAPITEEKKKAYKCGGPNLKSTPDIIEFLKYLPNAVVSGANNHIFDYGQKGIEDTIHLLLENGIAFVGFGRTYEEAREPLLFHAGEITIGLYSCSQIEFSIADETHGGANPFDYLTTFDDISDLKRKCEKCIVLYHAGRENYRYPTIEQQRICRKMIDAGADMVVCQHNHCIACAENWKDGVIVYGQGNFIFDRYDIWDKSLLIRIDPSNISSSIEYVPFGKGDNGCIEYKDDSLKTMQDFLNRSVVLKDEKLLEKEWEAFCMKPENITALFLGGILGIRNRYLLAIDKRLDNIMVKVFFGNKDHRQLLLNFLRCSTIQDNLKTCLSIGFHKK